MLPSLTRTKADRARNGAQLRAQGVPVPSTGKRFAVMPELTQSYLPGFPPDEWSDALALCWQPRCCVMLDVNLTAGAFAVRVTSRP